MRFNLNIYIYIYIYIYSDPAYFFYNYTICTSCICFLFFTGLERNTVGKSPWNIVIFNTIALKGTSITISSNTDSHGNCSYSIEVLHFLKVDEQKHYYCYIQKKSDYLQTAYGFHSGTSDEYIFAGLTKNASIMSIFNGNWEANSFSMAEAQIRAINLNGTLEEPELLPISVESENCSYSYYTQVPECSAGIYGYQTQIRIPSTLKQQQQISVICQKPTSGRSSNVQINVMFLILYSANSSCGHGYESGGVCQCYKGWTGMDCRQPICDNGGIADGEICNCPWLHSGIRCGENPRGPIGLVSGLAFIVDTIGSYPSVYNSSITAIKEFVLGSHLNVSVIVVVDNASQKLASYNSVKQFESHIGDFERFRDLDSEVNLDGAFTRILKKFEHLKYKGNNLIFYVTQIGGILENRTNINILERQYNSTIIAIGMSDYKIPILDIVMEQLRVLTENVSTADNWYTAMMEMFRLSSESNYSTPTPR
uniref:EGF-like domain-containing protein n=1 Tax=Heterorhabditis bacteriophora TaxID=37862 RepID=A0A1I7XE45_HETBA